MDSFLFTVLSFLLAIGVLITVHEFGHFWVARRMGVKVLRFSIGFGRPLWTRIGRVDGTEYVVAAVPLGGYVKMLDEREEPVAEEELERAFNRKPLSARVAIVMAGPLFNFLFAVLAYWIVFVSGDIGTRPIIGEVVSESPAEYAGFVVGDELLEVGERKTPSWETALYALLAESGGDGNLPVRVRDERGNERVRLLTAKSVAESADGDDFLRRVGLLPWRPVLPAVIGTVVRGEAADFVGLISGDRVVRVDEHEIADWEHFVSLIRAHPGQVLGLDVERNGTLRQLRLQVGARKQDGVLVGRIGASPQIPEEFYEVHRIEVRLGVVEAARASLYKTWDISLFMLKMLGRMVSGQTSVKNLGGPISIAQSAGQSASFGPVYFLKFLAMVSISLGVLNLLPVPVLDGGHLLFFLVEAVKGSPLSEAVQMQGQRIGMALLLALMGLAFYIDIARLLG